MPPGVQVSDDTTFTFPVVALLISLAFSLGANFATFVLLKRRVERLETHAVRKHWFANWLAVFALENPRLHVPKPDEIKSQD